MDSEAEVLVPAEVSEALAEAAVLEAAAPRAAGSRQMVIEGKKNETT